MNGSKKAWVKAEVPDIDKLVAIPFVPPLKGNLDISLYTDSIQLFF